MTHDDFISKVGTAAHALWGTYQILPSVTIAQAILESGWGTSELAVYANALFGIKAGSDWTGSYYPIKTKEYSNGAYITVTARFRKYSNWSASIVDHCEFLHKYSRYANIIGNADYKDVCNKLQADGYATDPTYAQKLIRIIETNSLTKYDEQLDGSAPRCIVTYTVQEGDTLGKIARVHNTTVSHIVEINNISNVNLIYAGQVLNLN